jgi:hypothetical protein
MDTKNVLVFLAGAAVAYFVIKEMDKQKTSVTPVPVPPVDSNSICEEALNTQMMTMRFASDAEREAFIKDYMDNCLRGDSTTQGPLNTGCPEGQVLQTVNCDVAPCPAECVPAGILL